MSRLNFGAAAVALACLLQACAAPTRPGEGSTEAPAVQVSSAQVALEQARQYVRDKNLPAANRLLDGVLSHPDFPTLDVETRLSALHLAGNVSNGLATPRKGLLPLLQQACEWPEAGFDTWRFRFGTAFLADDYTDSVLALTTIAERWPNHVPRFLDEAIFQVVTEADRRGIAPEARYRLIQALFDANWRTKLGREPSWLWYSLAVMRLERGDLEGAAAPLKRVTSPSMVVMIRADKRFDAVPIARESTLDVRKALELYLAETREAVAQNPRSLDAVVQMTYALLGTKRFDEVLDVTAPFALDSSPASFPALSYDDWGERIAWILDNRARALTATGRPAEALKILRAAAKPAERDDTNVSNVLNLAWALLRQGQPRDALDTIELAAAGEPNAYGRMQIAAVRLRAALALKDRALQEQSLNYLREHENDSQGTLQGALVVTGQHDEAARLLSKRLADTLKRGEVLVALQGYYSVPESGVQVKWSKQWKAFLARPDVRAAIARVGRIEQYPYYFTIN